MNGAGFRPRESACVCSAEGHGCHGLSDARDGAVWKFSSTYSGLRKGNSRSSAMSARGLKAPSSKKTPVPPPARINGRANGKVNGAVHDDIDQEALLRALQAMRVGDFSVRMAADKAGVAGKIADAFNDIVAANERMAQQLERVGEVVGKEGKTRQRVKFAMQSGAWGEMEGSINAL